MEGLGHPETSERGQRLERVPRGEEGVIARLVSYVMIRERVTALDLIEMIMGDRERNPGRERGKRGTCENKPGDQKNHQKTTVYATVGVLRLTFIASPPASQ